MSKRAIVIVLDGCGAGEAPDSAAFGDFDHPATVRHVWEAVGGFHAPNLASIGFLRACGIDLEPSGSSAYGRLRELSQGKDSVTGHWELMGVVTPKPFPTYPGGFPQELVANFERAVGRQMLGNKPASGTDIIRELGPEHVRTGSPILYTSADSVFQIACHELVVPVEELYSMCQIARELCIAPNDVQRVIARPFSGSAEAGYLRTERRRDFPLEAPHNLIDEIGEVYGVGVVPELFNGRGFRKTQRTQSNAEHEKALSAAMESDARFIFANFEDFDMLYGHRNDPIGFAMALERFDATLACVRARLTDEDLLILCADHGNDPTSTSTDHSREFVPCVAVGPDVASGCFGDVDGMTAVAATVARRLDIPWSVGHVLG